LKKKKNNPSKEELLKKVEVFADLYKDDPLLISACLMVVAKDIYLNTIGPEQTLEMMSYFANSKIHTVH
tara:strand:+ start:388 stop:594 length:207 start_codon:yes stop_codon:yes gene_type:complete